MGSGLSSDAPRTVGIRCPRCGAPLEITPESILVVCKYCGYPYWTSQAYVYPIYIVPSYSEHASRFFESWLKTDKDMRKIASRVVLKQVQTTYVPAYLADSYTSTDYYGKLRVRLEKRVTKKDSEGNTYTEIRRKSVTVTVDGHFEKEYQINIVARRSVDKTIVDPILSHFREDYNNRYVTPQPLARADWSKIKGDVLSAEIPPKDAESYARDETCDMLISDVIDGMRRKAKKIAERRNPGWRATSADVLEKKIPCNIEKFQMSPLMLVPYIVALYDYGGKIYKAVFSGWDGMRVWGEEPILPTQRLLYYTAGLTSTGLLAGLGSAILISAIKSGSDPLIGIGLLLVGLLVNGKFASLSIKGARIEKIDDKKKEKESASERLIEWLVKW
ncbi:MAG: zinc ribbon domain-containing protein [Desulfurococcales archaeon]|nr:zinc ribbon domain-containing protein [Desulfurococcales archaeon]